MRTLFYIITSLTIPIVAHGQQPPSQNPGYSVLGRSAAVPQEQAVGGIKQALLNGVHSAVRELGHEGGFLTNLNVRIPIPKQLQPIANTLRLLKQDQLADELVATMIHAAERAVPEGVSIFSEAISHMTLSDAE